MHSGNLKLIYSIIIYIYIYLYLYYCIRISCSSSVLHSVNKCFTNMQTIFIGLDVGKVNYFHNVLNMLNTVRTKADWLKQQ